jgi:acetyl esterase/lipase
MKAVLLVVVMIMSARLLPAQQQRIPLYDKEIPNSKPAPADYIEFTDSLGLINNVTHPTLTPYFPKKGTANGTAVIVCPGGGYGVLAAAKAAIIARYFTAAGITAFMLNSRLPNDLIMQDKTIGPLQDAQTALALVRKRATEWGINPKKVGFLGISAGGHLATTAGTHFDKPVIENKEKINLRPDFMVLVYPVILFDTAIASGTRENLIGEHAPDSLQRLFSNEKHVTAATPPTFLVHAADDDVVPVKNSLVFFNTLQEAHVKSSMHIFQSGGHGFRIDDPQYKWFDWCRNWLKENGF